MMYFGYGSNLNAADLLERAGLVLTPVGRAMVCDQRLVFNYRSGSREGGALSMLPALGHVVEGVLYDIPDDRTWKILDRKEGAGSGCYERRQVTAFAGGQAVDAITYVTSEDAEEPYVKPHPQYVRVLEDGYMAHGINPAPMQAAARGLEAPRAITAIFVYGTLLRGQCLHPCLQTDGRPRRASVRGRLLDLGMYPALVEGEGHVHGECYMLDDVRATLHDLDQVEGFDGSYDETALYHRVPVNLDAEGTPLLAWTYRLAERSPEATPIPHGCWRCHRGDQCEEVPHA